MIKPKETGIRERLLEHRGAIAEVTRRTTTIKEGGYTRSYVDMVLRGQYNNDDLMVIAVEVLAERDARRKTNQNRIKSQLSLTSVSPA